MAQISIRNLTFCYEGSYDNVFEEVSFQIDTDWKLGLVGRNGRGKTTFLKLLMGEYEYRGSISCGEVLDYFPFEIKDKEKNAIDIIEEIEPDYEFWKVSRELTCLHAESDILFRPFFSLSSGEQTKVMLALLFSRDNHFLLIDEPTNHLDMEARQQLREYLNTKKGYILVSHDRNFMDGCVDHVLVINKTNIEVQQGNFSSWWENKKRQDHFELAENEKLKKDIQRLTQAARQSSQWAERVEAQKIGFKSCKYEKCLDLRCFLGEKSRRMQMRRKNLERRQEKEIEEKSKLLKNLETVDALKLAPLKHYKERLIKMENCSLVYKTKKEGAEINRVFDDFNFELKQGERVFLKGSNGCGKSSVIKAILNQIEESFPIRLEKGSIEVASQLIVAYCSQDTSRLHGTIGEYAAAEEIDETLLRALLHKLDFSRTQFEKRIEDYSGGQKKKVLLAGSLCKRAHLYIWDEPLNFIDVFSRMQIEELILKFQPTMILVEHDKSFMEHVATRVIEIT